MHFFGSLFGVLFRSHIGESDVLLGCAFFLVSGLSLRVETNHQLVDHYTNDGAKEWGKNRDQKPAVSNPEERRDKVGVISR